VQDLRRAAPVIKRLDRFGADAKGLAAVDFAITGTMLVFGLLNAVDLGYYIYRRMEVENAADAGAQAVMKTCDQNSLPATTNCSGLNAAITSAIHNTSLGTAVSLALGYPTEGYYCTNSSTTPPTGALLMRERGDGRGVCHVDSALAHARSRYSICQYRGVRSD
jgi:Flp pilus assembly protein TadG